MRIARSKRNAENAEIAEAADLFSHVELETGNPIKICVFGDHCDLRVLL
jgi:hypothetical protein